MSLLLPPVGHPAREFFEVAHLVEIADPGQRAQLPTLPEAKRKAAKWFAQAGDPALKGVTFFVLHADGSLRLQQFGPKGGRKQLWNFG